MFLQITTTHRPATDLGFLLHKNPARLHEVELTFGKAWLCFPEATDERCTASLISSWMSIRSGWCAVSPAATG
jgi:hypothetical protein